MTTLELRKAATAFKPARLGYVQCEQLGDRHVFSVGGMVIPEWQAAIYLRHEREPTMPDPEMRDHVCDRDQRRELRDARGIFCTFVCNVCEKVKRRRFRAEIFADPNYEADEAIDDD